MRIFNPGEESMRLFMSLFPMRWNLRVVARSDSQEDQERKLKARDALNGWDPTYGCLYYYNPATAVSAWIWSREVRLTIGAHSFAV